MNIARLIRQARLEAGLTQRELAARARTSQPTLARYETGLTTPTLATLDRILRAAGATLRLEISHRPTEPGRGPIAALVESRRDQMRSVLIEHGVREAAVFGSVSRGEDSTESDLDLLVDLPEATYVRLGALRADLEDVLGVPVDVTTPELLTDEIRDVAEREAIPL